MSEPIPSELGDLPADWPTNRFDSLFAVQQGKQVSKKNRVGGNQCAFLRTKNVFWGRLDLSELDEMNFTEADERRLALSRGDLLICEGGDIGRTAIWNGELARCYYQNHLHRARLRNGNASPQFVLFWLWYAFEVGSVYFGRGNATTIPNLSQSKLCELPLPVPPVDEQRKIAAVLGLVQRAMGQQERLLALTAELKKALLHQLFTQGLRHEPQKQTEIGPIPQSWELRSIDELNLDIGDGNYSTKYPRQEEFLSKGVPFLRANNVVDGRLIWNDMRYISPELHAELRKGHTKKDDVCLVTRGNIGEAAFVIDEFIGANMNAQLVRINGGNQINGKFLYFALTHPATQEQFKSLKTGTALQQLPIGKLKFVRIPIPSKDEQVEIAESLWLVSEKRMAIERKHVALSALFRTLLHELMTARIRVHDLDVPSFS